MRVHFHARRESPPPDGPSWPLNAVVSRGRTFLRVTTACEVMLHLAPLADDVPVRRRRAAVNDRYSRLQHVEWLPYDHDALAERCWGERTLCGLTWWEMAGHGREVELAMEAATAHRVGYTCPWCESDAACG